jgi:uncharacterized protein YutE (UPF0331/DUF86 family)
VSPGKVSSRILLDRAAAVSSMTEQIRRLPLATFGVFADDSRNIWTVDSCLRRALEAVFDMGRHLLAKGYGAGVTEYKEIARELGARGVLGSGERELMVRLAGYRNRLVHFYHEVNPEELYQIATGRLGDVERIRDALVGWLRAHPEMTDATL